MILWSNRVIIKEDYTMHDDFKSTVLKVKINFIYIWSFEIWIEGNEHNHHVVLNVSIVVIMLYSD